MDDKNYLKYFYIFSQVSFVIIASIVIFLYLGSYVDKKFFSNSGIFTTLGIFIGLFSAGYNSYKIYKKYLEEMDKK